MSLGKAFRMERSGGSMSDDIGCSCYRCFAEELVMRLGGLDLEEQKERRRSAVSLPDSLDIRIFSFPSHLNSTHFFSFHILYKSIFYSSFYTVSILYHFALNFKFYFLFYNIYHSKYNFAQFSTIIHYWCPSLGSNTVSHSVKSIKTIISRKSFFSYSLIMFIHDEIWSFSHIYLLPSFFFLSFPLKFFFLNKSSPALMLWAFDFISFLSSLTH